MKPAEKKYRYHEWANRQFFDHQRTLPQDVLTAPIPSVFPTVLDAWKHIYMTDFMWIDVMKQLAFDAIVERVKEERGRIAGMGMAELEEQFAALAPRYVELFESMEEEDPALTVRHPQYGELTTTLSELVQHVANHGTYHRGNVSAMLRQQGQSGASTDYIFYLYAQSRNA